MGNGTAVREAGGLFAKQLELGRWHRSKDKKQKPDSDYGTTMMNKKWCLEEQFNLHMMRYQQVKCWGLSNKLTYLILGWFADEWSSIRTKRVRGGGATWATQDGSFLLPPDIVVRGYLPLRPLLHGGDHHQALSEKRSIEDCGHVLFILQYLEDPYAFYIYILQPQ